MFLWITLSVLLVVLSIVEYLSESRNMRADYQGGFGDLFAVQGIYEIAPIFQNLFRLTRMVSHHFAQGLDIFLKGGRKPFEHGISRYFRQLCMQLQFHRIKLEVSLTAGPVIGRHLFVHLI